MGPTVRVIRALALALALLAAAGCEAGAGADGGDAVGVIREIELVAREADVDLGTGAPVRLWTYNGAVPGPVLEADVGDELVVRFRNELPEETTIHWHGLRVPAEMDGTTMMHAAIPPGGTFEYRLPLLDAGLFWYHPHVRSDEQVERGLYGAVLVHGPDEPVTADERVLVLDDVLLAADGGLAPFSTAPQTRMLGREGDVLLVNGRADAELVLRPRERQRWRLVNAATARYFRLAAPGLGLTLIGHDGALLEAPQPVEELLLAPGERADWLVTAPGDGPAVLTLLTLPYARGHETGAGPSLPLAAIRVEGPAVAEAPALPARLAALPAIPAAAAERELRLSEAMGSGGGHGGHGGHGGSAMDVQFFINGKSWPDVPVLTAARGSIEVWTVVNESGMDHPFHLHGFTFEVLESGGVPAAFRARRDTVNIPASATVKLAVSFDGFAGSWMYHCHILEHAEVGMAGEVRVTE